ASEHTADWLEKKCRIPAVTAEILVQRAHAKADHSEDVLDIIQHVTTNTEETAEELAIEEIVARHQPEPPATAQTRAPAAPANGGSAQIQPPETSAIPTMAENLLRVDAERIDLVMNLVGELIIAKSMMHQAINDFEKRFPKDALKGRFSDAMAF